jgi:hypothetical protein
MISAIESLATGNSRDVSPGGVQTKYQPLVVIAIAQAIGIVLNRFGGLSLPNVGFCATWLVALTFLFFGGLSRAVGI